MDKTRFDCVKVDDGRALPSDVVNHDIGGLWVAMNRAEFQFASRLGVLQDAGPLTSALKKFEDIPRDLGAVKAVTPLLRLQRVVKRLEISRRDVESGERVVEHGGVHVRDGMMELPEDCADLMRMVGALNALV